MALYIDRITKDPDYQFNKVYAEALQSGKSLSSFYKKAMSLNGVAGSQVVDTGEGHFVEDAEYGLGYLPVNAFDLLDRAVHLPIKKFFAPDFVPIRTGGGVAERLVAFRAQEVPVEMQLAGGQNNSVPLVNGAFQPYSVPVLGWEAGIKIGVVDLMKAQKGNYSILEHHEESLRTSYWFRVEKSSMIGNIGIDGITTNAHADFVGGLLNQPEARIGGIVEAQVDVNGTPTDKALEDMTIDELANVFGDIIERELVAVRYNRDFFINRIALYPELYKKLVVTPATIGTLSGDATAVITSQLEYLKRHLSALTDGEIQFGRLPYLSKNALTQGFPFKEDGQNSLGRVIFYHQGEKAFYFGIPMPLTLGALLVSPTENGYRKNGLTFMASGILINYKDTIWYLDNTQSGE